MKILQVEMLHLGTIHNISIVEVNEQENIEGIDYIYINKNLNLSVREISIKLSKVNEVPLEQIGVYNVETSEDAINKAKELVELYGDVEMHNLDKGIIYGG